MAKLAVKGSEKAITLDQKGALEWPLFGDEEKKRIIEVLEMGSQEAGKGWYTEAYRFEEEFRKYLGAEHALAHNNGTAAIHAALFAIGIKPGDEVIVPSYTYWASCMPVLCWGGVPVFVEVDPKSATIDQDDVEKKITPKTKAIIAIHLWGMPCEMDRIMEIAKKHNLKVIEDAAQAHGAEYRGKKVGTIGEIGCFSFQSSKNLPAIEGGMLVTDSREYYERAIVLGHYLRVKELPEESPYRKYSHTCMGYKYRMHPLAAAIGRIQLKYLDERNKKRDQNIVYVNNHLKGLKGIEVFETLPYMKRIYYQYEIIYHEEELGVSKEKFVEALEAEGARVKGERYPLQHQQPVYKEKGIKVPRSLPASEKLRDRIIALPAFPHAEKKLLDQYIEAFRKVIDNINELRC